MARRHASAAGELIATEEDAALFGMLKAMLASPLPQHFVRALEPDGRLRPFDRFSPFCDPVPHCLAALQQRAG